LAAVQAVTDARHSPQDGDVRHSAFSSDAIRIERSSPAASRHLQFTAFGSRLTLAAAPDKSHAHEQKIFVAFRQLLTPPIFAADYRSDIAWCARAT
jgi:hypothetical protein